MAIQDISPCVNYSVENYHLMFSEVSGSGTSMFDKSAHQDSTGRVSVEVASDDGLRMGSQYNVTIRAANTAGSSVSTITLCKQN